MEAVSKPPAPSWRQRAHLGATAAAVAAIAVLLGACGDDSTSGAGETAGEYEVKVVRAEFPSEQRLGQTSLLRIAVENSGDKRVPELTVTISIAGKEGEGSSLPFAIRSPEPGLAQPDRPVWVLSEHYPRLLGSDNSAGADNASTNTFDFGPLKPRETTEAVWKLSAVKTGKFTVLYEIDASLDGEAKAVTADGGRAEGSLPATISSETPDTTVTDSGEVVEIPQKPKGQTR